MKGEQDADECVEEHDDQLAMIKAAKDGDATLLSKLLEDGCDINQKGKSGTTALHQAVINHQTEVLEILLRHKPDINVAVDDWSGDTALTLAAAQGPLDILEILLQTPGTNINACTTGEGRTALHKATLKQHVACVRTLLQHNCDVTIKDCTGNTALGLAVVCNLTPCVREFIQHGCDVHSTCFPDLFISPGLYWAPHTLLEGALFSSNLQMTQLLVYNGAEIGKTKNVVTHNSVYTTPRMVMVDKDTEAWITEQVKTPRSLTEISRLAIRGAIGLSIDKHVTQLPLPPLLKTFITSIDM